MNDINYSNVWLLMEDLRFKDPILFGQKKDDEQIINIAENILRVSFSSMYKKFLNEFSYAFLEGYILYGTDDTENEVSDLITRTNFYRSQNWPGIEGCYVVSDDGSGNPIIVRPDGSVWLSDHDNGFAQLLLADDFEEFLYRLLHDTLFEKEGDYVSLKEVEKQLKK